MTWEEKLRETSAGLGRQLERSHPNPPRRRRVRPMAAVVAVVLAVAAFLAWPRDPAAAIEAQYAGELVEVRIDDPELRREFEAALAQVDRAIALAKNAVRRSPGTVEFVELCHLALRAKVRLIQAYSRGG